MKLSDLGVLDGPAGHGGRRPGAGRKKGFSPKQARAMMDNDVIDDEDVKPAESTSVAVDFARARARKESALADLNELDYKVKSGEYVSRAAVRQASAELLAAVAQSLRSLPDILERKVSLAPDAAEKVEEVVSSVLSDLADGLAMFTGDEA